MILLFLLFFCLCDKQNQVSNLRLNLNDFEPIREASFRLEFSCVLELLLLLTLQKSDVSCTNILHIDIILSGKFLTKIQTRGPNTA